MWFEPRASFPWRAFPWVCAALLVACSDDPESAPQDEETERDAASPLPPKTSVPDAGDDDPIEAGSSDSGEDASTSVDPCRGVPTWGVCSDEDSLELCVVLTGSAEPRLATFDCEEGETCVDTGFGADCILTADCAGDATRCADPTTVETCEGGSFVPTPCDTACVASPLGAFCAPNIATETFSGNVRYEVRLPKEDRSDWASSATETSARGFVVISRRGDTLIDAAVTSDVDGSEGNFTIKVPSSTTSEDELIVAAAGATSLGQLAYIVVNPGFAASTDARSTLDVPPDPRLWSWSFPVADHDSGDTLLVPEEFGSGAARVFELLHGIYEFAEDFYIPVRPETVIVWVSMGTSWDCGACMTTYPTQAFGSTFLHQIWLDGSIDQGYWSDAVTAHELGHYVMGAYGYQAGEGGPHFLGFATNPGQAWSEGWATFFSSVYRDSSVYLDKQDGVFFWWDIDLRTYSEGSAPWQRPFAARGLEQLMDENEVAALLWGTSEALGDVAPVLTALASERMAVPPFARGYLRRVWENPEKPEVYQETAEPAPYLADFFDALRCSESISSSLLDTVTEPNQHYPYPSESPLCE